MLLNLTRFFIFVLYTSLCLSYETNRYKQKRANFLHVEKPSSFFRDWKDGQELQQYVNELNRIAKTVHEKKFYDFFTAKHNLLLGYNQHKYMFLNDNEEFYREEFNIFDVDRDNLLNSTELQNRQNAINSIIYPQLLTNNRYEPYNGDIPKFSPFYNNIIRTLQMVAPELEAMDFQQFAHLRATTDMIDGYTLYKYHDNYAASQGRYPENGYICIAEFGWMMRYWLNLLGLYDGPYDDPRRSYDFRVNYSTVPDNKMRILELAAYKSRLLKDVLLSKIKEQSYY